MRRSVSLKVDLGSDKVKVVVASLSSALAAGWLRIHEKRETEREAKSGKVA